MKNNNYTQKIPPDLFEGCSGRVTHNSINFETDIEPVLLNQPAIIVILPPNKNTKEVTVFGRGVYQNLVVEKYIIISKEQ